MSNSNVIRVEKTGHIVEVILDRPDKLNAMTPDFFEEWREAFQELDEDDAVRAVVVWAEGRHFTAGLDLMAAQPLLMGDGAGPIEAGQHFGSTVRNWQDAISAPECCRKPVIVAVHGRCIGGGVDLTTACDIRVCTEDASFSIEETKIAITADLGTLQRISGITGRGVAREMAYTGNPLTAERALQCGLVNAVYADKDALLEGARALANDIAANSPLAVQGTKRSLLYSEAHSLEAGLEDVAQWNTAFLKSEDLMEAMTAYMEKRAPEFKGR